MKTPEIPQWIRELSHPAYRNIYSYNLGQTNLWGTETLLGDWDGEFLLVAQDFYPSSWIEGRLNLPTPYAHNPDAPTNRNLLKTLRHFGALKEPHRADASNFLYVSACFLMRGDGLKRAPLPHARQVLEISAPVISFTLKHMRRLKVIVLMGRKADAAFRLGGNWKQVRDRDLKIFTVSHPACAMRDEDRFSEWRPVFGSSYSGDF